MWTRSSTYCDNATIVMGTLFGTGSINCISPNCWGVGILASASVPCVAFNVIDDFSVVEGSTIVNLPANRTIEAGYQGLYLLFTI